MTKWRMVLYGAILIAAFSPAILVRGLAAQTTPPKIVITLPVGGETFESGSSFTVTFRVEGSEMITGFVLAFSTNGGESYSEIGRLEPMATSALFNAPAALATNRGRIRITVFDRSGNSASAESGLFSIRPGPNTQPGTRIVIIFEPPTPDNPGGVRLKILCPDMSCSSPDCSEFCNPPGTLPEGLLGFNIYRLPLPRPGEPIPTAEQIIDPNNLVGSTGSDTCSFTDTVSTDKGFFFIYAIAPFFNNGTSGSPIIALPPIIRDPFIRKGFLFFNVIGFNTKEGAVLIVNDKESYPIEPDPSGLSFRVKLKQRSSPGGVPLRKFFKKGAEAQIRIKNPDGEMTCNITFVNNSR
jgi:hypothetical protein